jgi:uncharacterized protein HemY
MEPESLTYVKKAILVCYGNENYKAAEKFCVTLLKNHPEYAKAYLFASEIMAKRGDRELAERYRAKYIQLLRNPPPFVKNRK